MPSAARVSWAKIRVSVVSLVALLILSTLLYLLTGGTVLEKKTTLYLYIADASGVGAGSPVRVDGIGVGKVSSVKLSGSRERSRVVQVVLEVERDRLASIPEDSVVQISSDTLIGDKFVDISSGTSPRPIRPDAEMIYKEQPDLMKTIDLEQFRAQLATFDAVLRDIEEGRSRVGQFVIGEQMYDDLQRRLADLQSGIRRATDATSRVGGVLRTDRLYRQIGDPLVELDRKLARLQSGQGDAGRFLRDTGLYESWRSDARDLRRSIADFQASGLMQSDGLYDDWNRYVASLIRSVDEANAAWFREPQAYDSLTGAAREMSHTVREFREHPQRFLRMKLF
ncbi:MAG: MlaD family protein [Acidobacteriia bacterium]|nr:MlaD family protein [Terriglobia bacterium]